MLADNQEGIAEPALGLQPPHPQGWGVGMCDPGLTSPRSTLGSLVWLSVGVPCPPPHPCPVRSNKDTGSWYLHNLLRQQAVSRGDNPPLADDGATTEMFISCLNTHLPWKLTHLSLRAPYNSGILSSSLKKRSFTTFW